MRLGLVATLLSLPLAATADPRVLVLAPAEAQPAIDPSALAEAIDLAIGDLGITARSGPALAPGPLDASIVEASRRGRADRALAVVWATGRVGAAEVLVHVLDLRTERAVVQLLRLADRAGSAATRVVALKVRHLLGLALIEQASESPALERLVRPVVRSVPRPPPRLAASVTGVAVVGASALRLGAGASLSARLPLALEATLSLAYLEAADARVATGRVQTREIAGALALERLVLKGSLDLAVGLAGRLRSVSSTGVTRDGRAGSAAALVPELAAIVSARIAPHPSIALFASLSPGVLVGRQRMLLRGEEAFDLGRFALEGRLGVWLPGW